MNVIETEKFIVIIKEQADAMWPDGWSEQGLRQQGILINHPIDEDDLSLWENLKSKGQNL